MKYSTWEKIWKRKQKYTDECFSEGQILEFCPGYHTKNPYFVEVVFYNKDAKEGEVKMITNIPGQHECKMTVGSNWEYHVRRVDNIYYKKDFPELLCNQPLI